LRKSPFDLPDLAAIEAEDTGDLEMNEGRFAPDRQGVKGARAAALVPDLGGTAVGTAMPLAGLFDAKAHLPSLEGLAGIVVADKTEGMVQ
jgi:hypothetical protein